MATADTRSRDLKLYSDAQLNTILNLQLDKKRALEVQYDEYLDYSLDRYMEVYPHRIYADKTLLTKNVA